MKRCIACDEEILAGAVLCKFCKTRQDDPQYLTQGITSAAEVSTHVNVAGPVSQGLDSSTCPVCKQNDAVQSVATVVDGGRSTSVNVGMYSQFMNPLNAFTGLTVGASNSNLASRLTVPYPTASFRFLHLLYGTVAMAFILKASVFAPGKSFDAGSDGFDWFFAIVVSLFAGPLLGLVTGLIHKAIEAASLIPRQQESVSATNRLRNSYYCFRDDVVFDKHEVAKPENFIRSMYRG